MSTPVYHDGYLLVGGMMMQRDQNKPAAVVLWPESRATSRRGFSDTSTAPFRDDFIYSARSFGEFVCVDAKTGEQLWVLAAIACYAIFFRRPRRPSESVQVST